MEKWLFAQQRLKNSIWTSTDVGTDVMIMDRLVEDLVHYDYWPIYSHDGWVTFEHKYGQSRYVIWRETDG